MQRSYVSGLEYSCEQKSVILMAKFDRLGLVRCQLRSLHKLTVSLQNMLLASVADKINLDSALYGLALSGSAPRIFTKTNR